MSRFDQSFRLVSCAVVCLITFFLAGCSGGSDQKMEQSEAPVTSAPNSVVTEWAEQAQKAVNNADHSQTSPIQQTVFTGTSLDTSVATAEQSPKTDRLDNVLNALHPLHALVGEWKGITSKDYGGFQAVDRVLWNWDFRTDRTQPALVMTSDASPYARKGRLTYLVSEATLEFQVEDPHGDVRTYRGTLSANPQSPRDANGQVQRSYQLPLTQIADSGGEARQQIVFNQQTSDQYRMELRRESEDGSFRPFDSVETRRVGTSLAINEEGQQIHTCIVSQGRGTIPVSYQGQSYWVCSTGCQTAFEDAPAWWIARFQKRNSLR